MEKKLELTIVLIGADAEFKELTGRLYSKPRPPTVREILNQGVFEFCSNDGWTQIKRRGGR